MAAMLLSVLSGLSTWSVKWLETVWQGQVEDPEGGGSW